jgi:hypothetical protein
MTPFEHLAVLISIILGLGITHLLTAIHHLIVARSRVRLYWLSLAWTGLMLVSQIEWWWASFALRHATTWNFFYFLFVLMSPVLLYLAAAFVLPGIEPGKDYDLRAHYYRNARWFFIIVAASPVVDGIRRAVQAGSPTDLGAVSNLVSAALLGSLAFYRRPAYHTVITVIVTAIFLYFIVSAAVKLV